VPWNR